MAERASLAAAGFNRKTNRKKITCHFGGNIMSTNHRAFSKHRSIGQRLERAHNRGSLSDTLDEWLHDWKAENENLKIKQSLGFDVSLNCLDANTKRVKALGGIFDRLFDEIESAQEVQTTSRAT
jgi:hypothetical protein